MSFPTQLAFRHKDGQGWTEGYHYATGSFATVGADIQNLATKRAAMLTTDCKITHARVGTNVKRLVNVIPLNGGLGYVGQIAPPTAPLEAAFLFVLSNPGIGYNRIFVRGFDRASIDGDAPSFSSDFSSAAGLWENFLFTSGLWNIVGTLGSPTAHHPVRALAPTPPRGITFTSTDNLGGPGTIITIHAATVPGYNGRKTILSQTLAGGTYTYTAGGAAPAATDAGPAAYATGITVFDQPCTSAQFEKVTRRGVGRPFGLLRGRAETLYALRP